MPPEALVGLRRRLDIMPSRHPDRARMIEQAAALYGVSATTLYRQLRTLHRPRPVRRADRGQPRKMPITALERWCEIIAALKLRTTNKKGRHLSTARALTLLEEHGVETPDGLLRLPHGALSRPTADRYLRQWGYDQIRLARAQAAVRFQARRSNELWHFDLSPSDLKHVSHPLWSEPGRGTPTLMLYSVVVDRSGVVYQEYRCMYGEDVEAALRFLFNAMAAKPEDSGLILQGIPDALYMDNGPIAKSLVFQRVLDCLGVRLMTHLPAGSDGRRPTARSKGKVERPFRTVKEAHETLYHFHQPENEAEANLWLHRYLASYNGQQHRAEPHSRGEDWLANLPEAGVRTMCAWERFCAFAREPERRVVGGDARVSVDGAAYEVDADLAGETVLLWWGLFDRDLYVEHGERRYGPYTPIGGPIPLHRYRTRQKTRGEVRADRISALAERLGLPRAALEGNPDLSGPAAAVLREPAKLPFNDPDPFQEIAYPNAIRAKLAIADLLGQPLARLPEEERAWINGVLAETLSKAAVIARVRRALPGAARHHGRGRLPMLTEVMRHYGFVRGLGGAGYYETEHHKQTCCEVCAAILAGHLVAVSGVIGCGKTALLRHLQADLARESKVLVSKSLAVDQERTTVATLIDALFYDLSPEGEVRIPKQVERRERELRNLIRRRRKPVALFIDEPHNLHPKTLTGLKRLMEVVADGGGRLSIVLAGHPKLRNDLRRPTMEEIGYRTSTFAFDGIVGQQREYISWLLQACAAEGTRPGDLVADAAVELLAAKLRTPLQIERHLTLAFEEGFRVGEKPVTAEVVEAVLSRQLDELEPRLTRHGYSVHTLSEQFNAKPAEIKRLLRGELDPARTRELVDEMRAAGLPL